MLMAELSRRSGVPVATIKYYLREGLLPAGTATAATRAEYGQPHLRRLRLIRALVEIGEVPIASIRAILAAADDESVSTHDLLGTVQYSLGPSVTEPAEIDEAWRKARGQVDELIETMDWNVMEEAPARTMLIAALAAVERSGSAVAPALTDYARAVSSLARLEVGGLWASADAAAGASDAAAGRLSLTESAVIGMVLFERVMIALRRLAQEDASARLNTGTQI